MRELYKLEREEMVERGIWEKEVVQNEIESRPN